MTNAVQVDEGSTAKSSMTNAVLVSGKQQSNSSQQKHKDSE
jgi:hypothetical protein